MNLNTLWKCADNVVNLIKTKEIVLRRL